jgi:hypothetical protein
MGGFYTAPGPPEEGEPRERLDAGAEIEGMLARFREAILRRPDDLKSLAPVMVQIERAAVRSKVEGEEKTKQQKLEEAMYNVQMHIGRQLFPRGGRSSCESGGPEGENEEGALIQDGYAE